MELKLYAKKFSFSFFFCLVTLCAVIQQKAIAQTPSYTPKTVNTQPQLAGQMVSGANAKTGKSYTVTDATVGTAVYTDRTYALTSLPASLEGATLIQTANSDKRNKEPDVLTFTLTQKGTVVVAYDIRAKKLPNWLSGWQRLTDFVGVNDSKISSMDLYSKEFPAGQVSLGGNLHSPATGALNNYFVLVTDKIIPTLVNNIEGNTGRTYILSHLAKEVTPYSDRAYTITSVPDSMVGILLIKTPNADKTNSSATVLTFELSEKSTVYVAYDPRATVLPAWLEGWQQEAEPLGINDYSIDHLNIFSKEFPAGTVSLGGNLFPPAAGAQSNYVVAIKPASFKQRPVEKIRTLLAYPNPNAGANLKLAISKYGSSETVHINLYDLLGKNIYTTSLTTDENGEGSTELNFERKVASGVYILRASSKSATLQRKVVFN